MNNDKKPPKDYYLEGLIADMMLSLGGRPTTDLDGAIRVTNYGRSTIKEAVELGELKASSRRGDRPKLIFTVRSLATWIVSGERRRLNA